MPAAPFVALLGLDVASFVQDAVKAIIDLLVPDFGSDWASHVVTWLVAVPDVTGAQFPALNSYAHDLTAVGFGLLGATTIAGGLQLWAGGSVAGHAARPAESLRRAAVAAGVLVSYPTIMHMVVLGTNLLTAAMIRDHRVVDGLDKAFGEALVVSAITGGISLGLAAGAAFTLLYFLAALFVMKIGLTAALAVAMIAGALVWGLYPLPQAEWLARTWTATLVAALTVPVTWACIFAAAALLASDSLVFTAHGSANSSLGPDLASLVKPFAAVACFWLAYKAPSMLLSVARAAGVGPTALAGPMIGGRSATHGGTGGGHTPEALVRRGLQTNADRFRAVGARVARSTVSGRGRAAINGGSRDVTKDASRTTAAATGAEVLKNRPPGSSSLSGASRASSSSLRTSRTGRAINHILGAPKRANDGWQGLADEGRARRMGPLGATKAATRPTPLPPRSSRDEPGLEVPGAPASATARRRPADTPTTRPVPRSQDPQARSALRPRPTAAGGEASARVQRTAGRRPAQPSSSRDASRARSTPPPKTATVRPTRKRPAP